jgi:hypothetical protein
MDPTTRLDVAVRLKPELSKRLDDQIERLKTRQPGPGWNRSGVMRMALELYLRAEEENASAVA